MKLRKQTGATDPIEDLDGFFAREAFMDALRCGVRPEPCGPQINFAQAVRLGRFGRAEKYTQEEQAHDFFDEQDLEISTQLKEVERLFINLAAALRRDMSKKLAGLAGALAFASEQTGLAACATAAPADPQALDLGLPAITLTPRILSQRPQAARVRAGLLTA
ncbi:MAG: hypothetical protein ACOY44_07675 [Pseudomonadota bacterium]